jgi:hypothetical protein
VITRKLFCGLVSTVSVFGFLCVHRVSVVQSSSPAVDFLAGFAEADITPDPAGGAVFLAGFGHNRKATASLDPIAVRAVVLRSGSQTIAIACADVIGLFFPSVERIRKELPDFTYVLVSSTHNHHGPDTLGLWGPSPFVSGVDPAYLRRVETQIVKAIAAAEKNFHSVRARIGVIAAPELLNDTRPPIVKHDELIALQFTDAATDRPAGLIVQWNCHPETLDSKNTRLSSDFVGPAVGALTSKFNCPVVYLSGAVGGMMTTIRLDIRDKAGQRLADGSVEKTRRYGELLAAKVESALSSAKRLSLEPLAVHASSIVLPVDNKLYLLGKRLGVFDRAMEHWTGDPRQLATPPIGGEDERVAVRTELAWLRLGDLDVAVIPGEIYPELVLGKVVDPPDAGADFPDAPIEPAIYAQLTGPHRMIVGLGNDELGYIIPKRQWDEKPPFTHGLTKAPYGEINSLGPDTAPLLCTEFKRLLQVR